jgi:hypothetical protein
MHTSTAPRFLIPVSTESQNFAKANEFARNCARWHLKCHGFGSRAGDVIGDVGGDGLVAYAVCSHDEFVIGCADETTSRVERKIRG